MSTNEERLTALEKQAQDTTVITQHTHLLSEHSRLLKTILERLPEKPS